LALNPLPPLEEKSARVREMFDRIAARYDRMNRLLTLGLDQRWRRTALDMIGVGSGDRVIDLACGTGDLAELVSARGAQVVEVDFALEMLRESQRRLGPGRVSADLLQADGEALPLPDGWASAATCGFALRSSLVSGDEARLFVGAGIVEGSQPELELAETRLKLRTMLGPLFEI
jgi:demethylmenaquinone methyltransferase/2-methoxy-6-polyprenyl-1,4-benzoquinol methylase